MAGACSTATLPPKDKQRLEALEEKLDAEKEHGSNKFVAALKALGLALDDFDPPPAVKDIPVSGLVPKDNVPSIQKERWKIQSGLVQARLEQLKAKLEEITDAQVARFEKVGVGVRPVGKEDLNDGNVENSGQMKAFRQSMDRKSAQAQAEQAKKGSRLATAFLTEKKRTEDNDAKMAQLEKRLKAMKKEKDDELAQRRLDELKAGEKRQAGVDKVKKDRREYEAETARKAAERLDNARKTRATRYSTDHMAGNAAKVKAKQDAAFGMAVKQEQDLLDSIERKRIYNEERLEQRRLQVEEEMRLRNQRSAEQFAKSQLNVQMSNQAMAENILGKHKAFTDRVHKNMLGRELHYKELSKSTGELALKARDKRNQNYERELKQRADACKNADAKFVAADERREAMDALKLKCGGDVHTFREIKFKTWGSLQNSRYSELKRSRDANTQALLFKCAEFDVQKERQDGAKELAAKQRQTISKNLLQLQDNARDGFVKILREPDERKVNKLMTNMGFDMPKLPDLDDDDGPDPSKPPVPT